MPRSMKSDSAVSRSATSQTHQAHFSADTKQRVTLNDRAAPRSIESISIASTESRPQILFDPPIESPGDRCLLNPDDCINQVPPPSPGPQGGEK